MSKQKCTNNGETAYATPFGKPTYQQLESDLSKERARVRVLTEFAHDIANEIYPYPDQAVRKADEALAKVRE